MDICAVTDSAYLLGGAEAGCARQSSRDLRRVLVNAVRACECRGVAVTYRKVRADTERRDYAEVAQR